MRIGNFVIFGRKPAPEIVEVTKAPKLFFGLKQAETVFDRASDHIKGDASKTAPFAIIATAEVLGAEVRIEEECTFEMEQFESGIEQTKKEAADVEQKIKAEIEDLLKRINWNKLSLEANEESAVKKIAELVARQDKIASIKDFFTIAS